MRKLIITINAIDKSAVIETAIIEALINGIKLSNVSIISTLVFEVC
jgi:hypothetical protein